MSTRLAVAVVVVVALAVRVAVVLATPDYRAVTDAGDFDYTAVSLAVHHSYPVSGLAPRGGPTAFRPPLFPLVLGGVYRVVGVGSEKVRWEWGRLFEAVLGAVVVLLVCLLGLRLWGRGVGLVAGGVAAVYPPLVLVGSSLLSESLFIPLVLVAVWAALRGREGLGRWWVWPLASGVFVGLAALTRGNGVVLVVPVWFLLWSRRPRWAWRSLAAPLVMVLATAVTLVPWTVRNASAFHQFVPVTTETGYALAGTYNAAAQNQHPYTALWIPPLADLGRFLTQHPNGNEAQASSALTKDAFRYIRQHPGSVVRTAYFTFLRLFSLSGPGFERYVARFEAYPPWLAVASMYTFWVAVLLAIAGAFSAAVRRAPAALWWVPAVIVLTCLLFEGSTRYRAPADPYILVLSALGLIALAERLRGRELAVEAR